MLFQKILNNLNNIERGIMVTFVDTHTHLYDEQFDLDRNEIIENAIKNGVEKILLPNCNRNTVSQLLEMTDQWPQNCYPMMGLHPCDVQADYKEELKYLYSLFQNHQFYGVGEIGLDFYWDLTFQDQQIKAFEEQLGWAIDFDLPVSIHTRKSIDEGINIVQSMQNGKLKGVFHCFSGNLEQAKAIIDLGFYLGIGGVATFKNGGLTELLEHIDLKYIVLETDAPYLAPSPYRGKRNESAYIPIIAQKIADIQKKSLAEVAKQTTQNALSIFKAID